ncbi:MAG: zinc-ribbon domain-containing protein [Clostridiales bacterium]|nr:zinc-ribbon domain-containing protein [Clostridiales bacterium]
MSFKEKVRRFLTGRYGGDGLNTVISVFSLVSFITAVIVRAATDSTAGLIISIVFYLIAVGAIAFTVFRTFSRNLTARRAEYEWFRSHIIAPFTRKRNEIKTRTAQSATHRFFRCPKCRQTVRVPKGKGKIRITCPKCGEVFEKKS